MFCVCFVVLLVFEKEPLSIIYFPVLFKGVSSDSRGERGELLKRWILTKTHFFLFSLMRLHFVSRVLLKCERIDRVHSSITGMHAGWKQAQQHNYMSVLVLYQSGKVVFTHCH
jgi:hypothetical protein